MNGAISSPLLLAHGLQCPWLGEWSSLEISDGGSSYREEERNEMEVGERMK